MSKRLTTRLANGGVMYDNGEYYAVCYPWNDHCLRSIDRMAIKLCELEDRIEQGQLVEVVRCKDCIHSSYYGKICHYGVGRDVSPDHYCGYGERRDDGT